MANNKMNTLNYRRVIKRPYGIASGVIINLFILLLLFGQQSVAQSPDEFDITLEDMGYADVIIAHGSRRSDQYYYYSLPANWEIRDGSYLTLDIERNTVSFKDGTTPVAQLEVWFNDQSVYIEKPLSSTPQQLQIDLPSDDFRLAEDSRPNSIRIGIDENLECDELEFASSLTIKNTSTLHLNYSEHALPIDLGLLPKPLYDRWAFNPSNVHIVLPDQFNETDVQAATIIAARLGQMTSNQLPISATVVSEQLAAAVPEEHIIVVGRPDENPLIRDLELPIPVVERQLALRSQMPMMVSPGSAFSYTLFVQNTTSEVQSLLVEDRFSPTARYLGCDGSCEQITAEKIRWDVGTLAPQQQVSTTITLQATSTISPNISVKHTATLFDEQGNILNVNTLSTSVGKESDTRLVTSPSQQSANFFTQETQAVAEDAGVIQEIVSPWNPQRVTIVVSGLTDEALLKAAQGLNPGYRFPGIWGKAAIVEDIQSHSSSSTTSLQGTTFASLGYETVELNAVNRASRQYQFEAPPSVTLNENAYLALHVAHSPSISAVGGTIKVTLNGVSIGGAPLDEKNLNDAWLQIPLNTTAIKPGTNGIRIEFIADFIDLCKSEQNYWLTIFDDSFLNLIYKPARTEFNLGNFPYPFISPGDMGNVTFALSDAPSLAEIEGLLQIASLFGSSSDSKDFMPQVTFGMDPDLAYKTDSHILAIGLPTMNPTIRAANDKLPQPFLPDSNDILQRVDNPVYGIAPGTDLGYVQALVSPWSNGENFVFVVATGTTPEGVRMAISALAKSSNQLAGDLALVRDDNIYTTDTRPTIIEDIFSKIPPITSTLSAENFAEEPVALQVSGQTLTPTTSSQQNSSIETPTPQLVSGERPEATPSEDYTQPLSLGSARPWWYLPLFITSILTIIVLIVFLVRKAY